MRRALGGHLTGRTAALISLETLLIVASVVLATYLRLRQWPWQEVTEGGGDLVKALLIALVCQVSLYWLDLYDLRVVADRREMFVRLVRALGVTSKDALASVPGAPPVGSVVPGYEVLSWFALYAPAKTPSAIVTKASVDIAEALKQPTVAARLADLGATAVGSTPEKLAETMRAEAALWGPVIRAAGVQPTE